MKKYTNLKKVWIVGAIGSGVALTNSPAGFYEVWEINTVPVWTMML
jgi:hypothetical protein